MGDLTNTNEDLLKNICHSPKGYLIGKTAANKLAKMSGLTKKQAQEWLDKHGIYQIYKPSRYLISST